MGMIQTRGHNADKMQVVCVRKVVGHESTKTYDDKKLRIGLLCA